MRFREFKRFIGDTFEQTQHWLVTELNSVMRELYIGLRALKFEENFKSFTWTGSLAASEVRQIPHPFGKAPSGYVIFKQVGDAVVDASTSEWTSEVVYLRNNSGSNSVTVTVIFFE
jgi:hypothetical protein